LNPDSWRKIRETAANVYPDSMLKLFAFWLSRTEGFAASSGALQAETGVHPEVSRRATPRKELDGLRAGDWLRGPDDR
jgi:hypothetical protein